ncbi:autoinducer binding domain-containing protein [Vibrio rumoiensis]|uniref:autoinducer binding domain-containing protein n=1 Tax=Vibrio rumoiensis TaxID=76258 RepID=UPI003AA7DEAD
MDTKIEDAICQIMYCQTADELINIALKVSSQLGFENFAFGAQSLTLNEGMNIQLVNTYPEEWNEIYRNEGFFQVDPVVRHGELSCSPLVWTSVKKASKNLWESAQVFGIDVGWSKSSFHPNGSSSLVSFSRSKTELTPAELKHLTPYLLWISSLVEQKFLVLGANLSPQHLDTMLTLREKEVLKWSSMGKTAFEISLILGIAERTVTFHANNAIRKLQTPNKIGAVSKAISLGLFS